MMITGPLCSLDLLTPGLWKPLGKKMEKHSDLRREWKERRGKWFLAEKGVLLGLEAASGWVCPGEGACQVKTKLLGVLSEA